MTLRAFMRAIALDPLLADQFRAQPEAIMDLYGLSAQARDALRTRDAKIIGRVLRGQPLLDGDKPPHAMRISESAEPRQDLDESSQR
jgi:hypothetical protein